MADEELGALKVGLSLEDADFTESMASITRKIQAVNSEFKVAAAGVSGFEKTLDGMQAKSTKLESVLELQRKRTQQLREEYEKAASSTDKNSKEIDDLLIRYNNSLAAMKRTESQLKRVNDQINDQGSAWHKTSAAVDASVKDMKQKFSVLNSEYKVAIAGIENFGSKTEHLQTQSNHLAKVLDIERDQVNELRKKYDEAVKSKGNDARETNDARIALNRAIASMKNTESELTNVNRKIDEQSTRWGRLSSRIGNFKDKADGIKSVGQDMATTFGIATVAVGGGLGIATKKAMDFESQMSSVKSVMDPSQAKEYGKTLEDLAVIQGAKTKYSALEAAQAEEELVKAGVSVSDIMGGGLSGALNLATAGELDLKDAAEIASTVLNAFKDDNLSVAQAANILAGAANASATDVGELKYGLSSVAAVASGLKMSFKDTATALAVLAQNGLKGQDAGTSLKTMLLNLSPSTEAAANMMAQLGLATKNTSAAYNWLVDRGIKPASKSSKDVSAGLEKLAKIQAGHGASTAKVAKEYQTLAKNSGYASSAFYDQNGKLKSLADISGLLHDRMKDLNEEQRQYALKVMFGTDAIRASNILYKEGAKGVNDMAEAMGKIKASDVAKQKMDNLKGSIEQLKGSLETAAISIGQNLTPAIQWLTKEVQKGVDWFNNLSPSMQKTIAIGGAVTTVALGLVTALGVLGMAIGGIATGFGAIVTAGSTVMGVIDGAGAAIAGLGTVGAGAGLGLGAATEGTGLLAASAAALANPVGIGIAAVAALGYGAYELNKHMEKPIMTVDLFGDKVSKSTKKAVGAYMDMNDKVTAELNELNWSGQAVTKDMANKITTNFSKMGSTITSSLKKEFDSSYNTLSNFLGNTKGLSKKEKDNILNEVKDRYNQQSSVVTNGEKRIKEIMDNASKHHRKLTSNEQVEINQIQANMEATAVDTLSKGAKEQRVIYANLQSQSGTISAKQAAQTVKYSKKATDQAIKDAKKKRDKVVEAIIHERDDTHSISADQADKLIKQANKQYSQSVSKAKAMHKKVVSEAKAQAGDHADQIDWETGKVKSGWDKMMDKVGAAVDWIKNLFNPKKKKSSSKSKKVSKASSASSNAFKIAGFGSATYAEGTNFHPGGDAILGDAYKNELYKLPNGKVGLSPAKPTLFKNFPRGAKVLNGDDTEKLIGPKMYADGIGASIEEGYKWLIKGPKALLDGALKKFKVTDSLIPDWFTSISGSPVSAIKDMAIDWVKNLIPDISGAVSGASADVKKWVATAMGIVGVPAKYLNDLVSLAMHESGGNPRAINLWDSNAKAGHPSKGLFQTIDSTFKAYALPGLGDIYNPIANAVAGIRYALSRYGSIGNIPGIKAMANGSGYVGYANGTTNSVGGKVMLGDGYENELYITKKGVGISPNVPTLYDGFPAGSTVIPFSKLPNYEVPDISKQSQNINVTVDNREVTKRQDVQISMMQQQIDLLTKLLLKNPLINVDADALERNVSKKQADKYGILNYQLGGT